MAAIQDPHARGADGVEQPFGAQPAIGRRPAQGIVVRGQIGIGLRRVGDQPGGAMPFGVGPQDRFARPARAAFKWATNQAVPSLCRPSATHTIISSLISIVKATLSVINCLGHLENLGYSCTSNRCKASAAVTMGMP